MDRTWLQPANLLTLTRIVLLPFLWGVALTGQMRLVGVGLLICGLTDALDGFVARRLRQSSALGARLDSIADQLVLVSGLLFVIILMPEIITDNWVFVGAALALSLLSLLVGLIKFRRLANLHLLITRISTWGLYIALIHAFLTGAYSRVLVTAALTLFSLAALEALAVQLISRRVDENMGSLWRTLRRRQTTDGR